LQCSRDSECFFFLWIPLPSTTRKIGGLGLDNLPPQNTRVSLTQFLEDGDTIGKKIPWRQIKCACGRSVLRSVQLVLASSVGFGQPRHGRFRLPTGWPVLRRAGLPRAHVQQSSHAAHTRLCRCNSTSSALIARSGGLPSTSSWNWRPMLAAPVRSRFCSSLHPSCWHSRKPLIACSRRRRTPCREVVRVCRSVVGEHHMSHRTPRTYSTCDAPAWGPPRNDGRASASGRRRCRAGCPCCMPGLAFLRCVPSSHRRARGDGCRAPRWHQGGGRGPPQTPVLESSSSNSGA
jgi:hypothetical protein